MNGRGQQGFLGQEAEHGRQPGHGQGGQEGRDKGEGHHFGQPAEAAQIARTGFMIDDAGDHEQGAFVKSVGQDADHQGLVSLGDVLADQHHRECRAG